LTDKELSRTKSTDGKRGALPSFPLFWAAIRKKNGRKQDLKIYLALEGRLVIETIIKRLSSSFSRIIIAAGQNDVPSLETVLAPLSQWRDIRIISEMYSSSRSSSSIFSDLPELYNLRISFFLVYLPNSRPSQ
jgi:hypothetical protein